MNIRVLRGQVISEYSIVVMLIVSVTVGMTLMVRRVLQARIKDTKDTVMEMVRADSPIIVGSLANMYDPYYLDTESEITRSVDEQIRMGQGGVGSPHYRQIFDNESSAMTNSQQAPPRMAD